MFTVPYASKLETYVRDAVFRDIQNMNGPKADKIPKAIAANRAEVFRRLPLVKPIPFGQRAVVLPNRFQDIGSNLLFVVFEELKCLRLFARGRFVPFWQFNPNRDRAVRRFTPAKRIVAAAPCLKSSPRWQQEIEFPNVEPVRPQTRGMVVRPKSAARLSRSLYNLGKKGQNGQNDISQPSKFRGTRAILATDKWRCNKLEQ